MTGRTWILLLERRRAIRRTGHLVFEPKYLEIVREKNAVWYTYHTRYQERIFYAFSRAPSCEGRFDGTPRWQLLGLRGNWNSPYLGKEESNSDPLPYVVGEQHEHVSFHTFRIFSQALSSRCQRANNNKQSDVDKC